MTNPQQENRPEGIIIDIGEDGTAKAYAIGLLEDLWHDVLFFEQQAFYTPIETRPFLHQRFLRAGLLCLFAYFDSVTRQWWYARTIKDEGAETAARSQARVSLVKRCQDLTSAAAAVNIPALGLNIKQATFLRNMIVHQSGGDHDLEVFEHITLETFQTTKSDMVRWLAWVGAAIGQKPHPDTDKSLDWLTDLGSTTHAEHSGDGLS